MPTGYIIPSSLVDQPSSDSDRLTTSASTPQFQFAMRSNGSPNSKAFASKTQSPKRRRRPKARQHFSLVLLGKLKPKPSRELLLPCAALRVNLTGIPQPQPALIWYPRGRLDVTCFSFAALALAAPDLMPAVC